MQLGASPQLGARAQPGAYVETRTGILPTELSLRIYDPWLSLAEATRELAPVVPPSREASLRFYASELELIVPQKEVRYFNR